jgi:hypothetical protein
VSMVTRQGFSCIQPSAVRLPSAHLASTLSVKRRGVIYDSLRSPVLVHLFWRSLPAVPPEVTGFSAPRSYRSFISVALGWCRWPPSRYSVNFSQPRCWPGCRFRRLQRQCLV